MGVLVSICDDACTIAMHTGSLRVRRAAKQVRRYNSCLLAGRPPFRAHGELHVIPNRRIRRI
jgi:hypothetical protein